MHRIPVSSSNISSVGYDVDTALLEVEFNSGDVYQGNGVSHHLSFGKDTWIDITVKKFGIEQVLKGVGRPRNGG